MAGLWGGLRGECFIDLICILLYYILNINNFTKMRYSIDKSGEYREWSDESRESGKRTSDRPESKLEKDIKDMNRKISGIFETVRRDMNKSGNAE